MKRKNQTKCYRVRAVTLIIVFKNIYQIFPPITLLKHVNNQSICATNYCLINRVINTLPTLLRKTFVLRVFKASKLWKIQCEDLQLSYFTKRGRNMFSVIRNLFIQWNMCESKERNSIINVPC